MNQGSEDNAVDEYQEWLKEKITKSIGQYKIDNNANDVDLDPFLGIESIASLITNNNTQADVKQVVYSILDMDKNLRKIVLNNELIEITRKVKDDRDKFSLPAWQKSEEFVKLIRNSKDPEYGEDLDTIMQSAVTDENPSDIINLTESERLKTQPDDEGQTLTTPEQGSADQETKGDDAMLKPYGSEESTEKPVEEQFPDADGSELNDIASQITPDPETIQSSDDQEKGDNFFPSGRHSTITEPTKPDEDAMDEIFSEEIKPEDETAQVGGSNIHLEEQFSATQGVGIDQKDEDPIINDSSIIEPVPEDALQQEAVTDQENPWAWLSSYVKDNIPILKNEGILQQDQDLDNNDLDLNNLIAKFDQEGLPSASGTEDQEQRRYELTKDHILSIIKPSDNQAAASLFGNVPSTDKNPEKDLTSQIEELPVEKPSKTLVFKNHIGEKLRLEATKMDISTNAGDTKGVMSLYAAQEINNLDDLRDWESDHGEGSTTKVFAHYLSSRKDIKLNEEEKALYANIKRKVTTEAIRQRKDLTDLDLAANEILLRFKLSKEKDISKVNDRQITQAMKEVLPEYLKESEQIPEQMPEETPNLVPEPIQPKKYASPKKSGFFKKAVYTAVVGAVGLALLAGLYIKGDYDLQRTKKEIQKYSQTERNNLKKGLEGRIDDASKNTNRTIEKIRKDIPEKINKAIPEPVKKAVKEGMKPISEAQKEFVTKYNENQKKLTEQRAQDNKTARDNIYKLGTDINKGFEKVYDKLKETGYKLQDDIIETADFVLETMDNANNKLEDKLDKKTNKLEEKIDNLNKSKITKDDAKKIAQGELENEQRKKIEKEIEIEKRSGFFTNWDLIYSQAFDSTATSNFNFDRQKYDLSEKLFEINGKMGVRPFYGSFGFKTEQGKLNGIKSALKGKNNSDTLFLGVGGSYPLFIKTDDVNKNKNILSWSAELLYRDVDSTTEGITGGFTNDQEGSQNGWRLESRLSKMKNNTYFSGFVESADGETKSITTSSTNDPYVTKLDTNTFSWGLDVGTSIWKSDLSKKLEDPLKKHTENSINAGISYWILRAESGDNTIRQEFFEPYLTFKFGDDLTKDGRGWEIKSAVRFGDQKNVTQNPVFSLTAKYEF